jgi:hypothetical protein
LAVLPLAPSRGARVRTLSLVALVRHRPSLILLSRLSSYSPNRRLRPSAYCLRPASALAAPSWADCPSSNPNRFAWPTFYDPLRPISFRICKSFDLPNCRDNLLGRKAHLFDLQALPSSIDGIRNDAPLAGRGAGAGDGRPPDRLLQRQAEGPLHFLPPQLSL